MTASSQHDAALEAATTDLAMARAEAMASRGQLESEHAAAIESLQDQIALHMSEVEEQHAAELTRQAEMMQQQQLSMQEVSEKSEQMHMRLEQERSELSADHSKLQDELRSQHAAELSTIREQQRVEHAAAIESLQEELRRHRDADLLGKATRQLSEVKSAHATALAEAQEYHAAQLAGLNELEQAREASVGLQTSKDHYEELYKQAKKALDSERCATNDFVTAAVKKAGEATASAVSRALEAETKMSGMAAMLIQTEQAAADSEARAERSRVMLADATRELDDARRLSLRAAAASPRGATSPRGAASAYSPRERSSSAMPRARLGGGARGAYGR
jgi:hypothetical protein